VSSSTQEIERTIEDSDVYWEMKWDQKTFPDMPPTELKFTAEAALALLLINNVIFLNSHWWEKDWPEEARKRPSLNVNTNDVFAWGCADAETINLNELKDVYDHYRKDPVWGTAVWACKRNNMLPQKPVYERIQKAGIWDLDALGLRANGMT
jgi:hypothetical protein